MLKKQDSLNINMISIKTDIQTFHKDTREYDFHGAKSQTKEMTFDELTQFIIDERRIGVHELLIGNKFKPYADLDYSLGEKMNENDFNDLNFEILHAGKVEM
jgi:hypothetical protein